jgi:hypothetical protein
MDLDHVAHSNIRCDTGESVDLPVALIMHCQTVRAGSDATLDGVMGLVDFDQYYCAHDNGGDNADGRTHHFPIARADPL